MINIKQLATTSALALVLGVASTLALAQTAEQGQANPGGQPTQQQTSVSDSHLALYLKAAGKVQNIRGEYQQKMPEAENTEEAQSLQQEAQQEMITAVESFGMTVDEYNQIAEAVQHSPELQSRLQDLQ